MFTDVSGANILLLAEGGIRRLEPHTTITESRSAGQEFFHITWMQEWQCADKTPDQTAL